MFQHINRLRNLSQDSPHTFAGLSSHYHLLQGKNMVHDKNIFSCSLCNSTEINFNKFYEAHKYAAKFLINTMKSGITVCMRLNTVSK